MSTTIESQSSSRSFAPDVLRVELLGGFRLSYGAQSVDDSGWRLAKARSLIKLLALTPGHTMHRDQLLEHLWPDLDPDSAMNNLHQALHVARRTLTDLIPDCSGTQILRLRRQVLSLEPPGALWVDVEAFEEFSSRAVETAEPDYYYRAIDLYQGELLPEDLYEDWADEHRTFLKDQYLAALSELASLHENRAEFTPAIDILRRMTVLDQAHEQASASLIRLYALTGRRQQALRQYERLTQALEREVGVEPDDETTALYQAIVDGTFPPASSISATTTAVAERPAPAAEVPEAAFERSPDFVGRESEILKLIQNLDRTVAGRGQIAMIAGEPGIGKTRIVEEFARYARARNVAVYWGRSYDGEGAPAYWPWVQIIRDYIIEHDRPELESMMGPGAADISKIVPELRNTLPDFETPPELDPDGERFRLFDSVTNFLTSAASQEPLVLLLEDVHWSDRSTLLLLEFLARAVTSTRILIIATYRHVEVSRVHPLTHTLGEFTRQGLDQRFNIGGLGVEEIEQYISTVAGQRLPSSLAAAVHHQSEGNPLFVREIVRLLIDEGRLDKPDDVRSWRLTIPSGIQETIALRTDGLSDNAYRILSTASVSGRDFELSVVSRVSGLDELDVLDALEEAMRIGLIEESNSKVGAFRFAHAITRETIYDELSQSRQLRMHLKTGETIEESDERDIDQRLPALAFHYSMAAPLGVQNKAITYLTQAGELEIRQTAYSDAVRRFQQALSMFDDIPHGDASEMASLLIRLGGSQRYAGDPESAFESLERSINLARQNGHQDLLGQAAIELSETAFQHGDLARNYLPLIEEALDRIDSDKKELRASLLNRLALDLIHAVEDQPLMGTRAMQASRNAVEAADEINDQELRIVSRLGYQQVLWTSESDTERRQNLIELEQLICQKTDKRHQLMFHSLQISEAMYAGDQKKLQHEMGEYERLAIELRQPANIWAASFRRTMRALLIGDYEQAERSANETLSLGNRSAPTLAREVYFKHLCLLRIEQDRAGELINIAGEVASDYPAFAEPDLLRNLVLAVAGDHKSPQKLLTELVGSEFEDIPRNRLWPSNIALLALITNEICHQQASEKLYSLLLRYEPQYLSGGGDTVGYGSASFYLGILATTSGDHRTAIKHLEDAVVRNTRFGARPLAAHSRFELARVLFDASNQRRTEEVSKLLSKSEQTASEIGMTRLVRRVHELSNSFRLVDGAPERRS